MHCLLFLVLVSGCAAKPSVRVATFNANLTENKQGALLEKLQTGSFEKAAVIAEIIQRVDPDVLLINEFDHDAQGEGVAAFQRLYLNKPQDNTASGKPSSPIFYPHVFIASVNTGLPTGIDLNQDGKTKGPADAHGFGRFPGQYGMAILSKHPIDNAIRTFQTLRWIDMPDALLPKDWYSQEAQNVLRLSSKSHWDVPILIDGKPLHLLAAHPTPPAFDGPEDRNGKRNHDEIRLWADYVTHGKSGYIVDDNQQRGGLAADKMFVILGDYNADPHDGSSRPGAIQQLLNHPRIHHKPTPTSHGAAQAAERTGGTNQTHFSDPAADTGDFNDTPAPGNLRVDYALPSNNLTVTNAGVFWPAQENPLFPLVGDHKPGNGFRASDHRLVWIDVVWPPR